MPRPQLPHRTERMLIVRVAIALGLAVLLLVGAWSNSHGESRAGSALCLASGVSASSVSDHQEIAATDTAMPDAGLVSICALVVFLLVLVALRLLSPRTAFRLGRNAVASASPRAGPTTFPPALTLAQLSLSRT
ncbi:hypothetical protein ACI3KT_01830 [Microbacterium sp. ZW T6_19]|uniref:hypothetical protein n=1 Tax=Microbacterium sp. ZW T6_19 TaxID=3378082 RepID=UPI0038541008